MKLPTYYDENTIGSFQDGPIRMNIPEVRFNNSNWPYIVRVGRIWSCLCMVIFPTLTLVINGLFPDMWGNIEKYILLPMMLGGLFVPMYIIGKKYQ